MCMGKLGNASIGLSSCFNFCVACAVSSLFLKNCFGVYHITIIGASLLNPISRHVYRIRKLYYSFSELRLRGSHRSTDKKHDTRGAGAASRTIQHQRNLARAGRHAQGACPKAERAQAELSDGGLTKRRRRYCENGIGGRIGGGWLQASQ